MLQHHTWTETLGKFAKRTGVGLWNFLRTNLIETKYGHRVLDQIFREGKFAPKETDKSSNH